MSTDYMHYQLPQHSLWQHELWLAPLTLLPVVVTLACSPQEAPTEPAQRGGAAAQSINELAAPTITTGFVDFKTPIATSLVAMPSGQRHLAYASVTDEGGEVMYAVCASNCTATASWQKVMLEPSGNYTSLKVVSEVLHVTYLAHNSNSLIYASCSSNCTVAANWQKVTVDATGGLYTSLAVDGIGRRHVSYSGFDGTLRYATCLNNCMSASNWRRVVVDNVGFHTSLAVDGTGRSHISYWNQATGTLKYATCSRRCWLADRWRKATVDALDAVGFQGLYTSLAVGADGVLHISYYFPKQADLKYARCAIRCTKSANWTRVMVDGATESVGEWTSLAVTASGQVHISYYAQTGGALRYANCGAGCLNSANWQLLLLDGDDQSGVVDVGRTSSLALGEGGSVLISYGDGTNHAVKYLALTP